MSSLFERLRAARDQDDIDALARWVPYANFLGISMETDGDAVRGKLTYSDHLIGNSMLPALHGGTIGALLESTAIFTLLWQAESFKVPKTINLTIEFLRTGRPLDTFARAELTKMGRRVANVRAFAWQTDPDRPIAAANMHFLLTDPDV